MKRADIDMLEKSLAYLPIDIKQHLADQLVGQIKAQAHTLLEATNLHRPCPHCEGERAVEVGSFLRLSTLPVPEPILSQNLQRRFRHSAGQAASS